jgi:RNA polymerase sigma factor (sigma-70 family)
MARPKEMRSMSVDSGCEPGGSNEWLEDLSQNHRSYRERLVLGICRTFRSYRLQRHEAEHIVDKALAKAAKHIAEFDPATRPFYVWLHMITKRCALDHVKSAERRRAMLSSDDPSVQETIATSGPTEAYAWKRLNEQLETGIQGLSQGQQDAIRLHYYEGLLHEDAAKKMGVSLRRFQQLLYEGRGNLGRVRKLKERYHDCDFLRKEVRPRKGRNRSHAGVRG